MHAEGEPLTIGKGHIAPLKELVPFQCSGQGIRNESELKQPHWKKPLKHIISGVGVRWGVSKVPNGKCDSGHGAFTQ